METITTQNEATKVVVDRANEMLKDSRINKIYQSHNTKDEADNWLITVALATLIIPLNERQSA